MEPSVENCAGCIKWDGKGCTDYGLTKLCEPKSQHATKPAKKKAPSTSDVLTVIFSSHRATLRYLRTTYTDQQILEFIQDNLITLVPTEIRPQCTNW